LVAFQRWFSVRGGATLMKRRSGESIVLLQNERRPPLGGAGPDLTAVFRRRERDVFGGKVSTEGAPRPSSLQGAPWGGQREGENGMELCQKRETFSVQGKKENGTFTTHPGGKRLRNVTHKRRVCPAPGGDHCRKGRDSPFV